LFSRIFFIILVDQNPSRSDEAFVEPPPKRVRSDASPAAVASEASVPKAAPAVQASTASSLSKEKDAPAAAIAPPSVSPSRM
jgi:hypothetical protein